MRFYRKNPKKLGHPKNCCNRPKIWTMWFYHRVINVSQICRGNGRLCRPWSNCLICVYTVWPDLSIRNLKITMVHYFRWGVQVVEVVVTERCTGMENMSMSGVPGVTGTAEEGVWRAMGLVWYSVRVVKGIVTSSVTSSWPFSGRYKLLYYRNFPKFSENRSEQTV